MKNTNLKTIDTVRESYNFKREKIIETGRRKACPYKPKENTNNNSNKNDTHCRGTVHRAQIENSTNVKYISILKNARITVGARLDFARYHRGITLIALIITVIVLLILAGVALNFIVGQNGILTHSETSKQQYELASAREELEMVIADIQTEILKTEGRKATLADLENRIDKNKYSILLSTDPIATTTAVRTNYTYATVVELEKEIEFTVDAKLIIREVELVSVKQGTAEVEISTAIKEYVGKDENDKYRVKYEITLSTIQGVKSITVESGEEKQELTIDENLTKEVSVEIGKAYTITVTMEDGKYKRKKIYDRATETIKTAEELAQFRDKVNSGLSYEGKTVELANDIDLSSVCHAADTTKGITEVSWQPIGNADENVEENRKAFSGIFDGNYHKISNLYINSSQHRSEALFGLVKNGTIKKLIVENVNVFNNWDYAYVPGDGPCAGGIVGFLIGGEIYNCGVEGGSIKSKKDSYNSNIVYTYAAGIAGYIIEANVYNSYNKSNVYAEANSSYSNPYQSGFAGGITNVWFDSNVYDCYSIGNASVQGKNSYVGEIVGLLQERTVLENSYAIGSISFSGTRYNIEKNDLIGGIAGTARNYYGSDVTLEKLRSQAFTNDIKNENNEWVYNNGYPILKWQLPENQK